MTERKLKKKKQQNSLSLLRDTYDVETSIQQGWFKSTETNQRLFDMKSTRRGEKQTGKGFCAGSRLINTD